MRIFYALSKQRSLFLPVKMLDSIIIPQNTGRYVCLLYFKENLIKILEVYKSSSIIRIFGPPPNTNGLSKNKTKKNMGSNQ